MKKIRTILVVFAFISLSTIVNAQIHSTQFCTGVDNTNYGGGWFCNQSTFNFYDHSTGPIVKWVWLFHDADNYDTLLVYNTFTPVVTRTWSNPGYPRVSLATLDTFGTWVTLEVGIHLAFTSTGIDENNQNSKILLYPNPANDNIFIEVSGNEKENPVEILDLSGRLIFSLKIYNKQNIDISSLKNGIYFCRIGSNCKKFIVTH